MVGKKGFSLLLKIIISAIVFILLVLVIIVYSKNSEKEHKISAEQELLNKRSNNSQQIQKTKTDYASLVKNYKANLIKQINDFDGNYQKFQNAIVNIMVPNGFQNLHLQMVLALNPAIYKQNQALTKKMLQDIADNKENKWLANDLNKLILNIK